MGNVIPFPLCDVAGALARAGELGADNVIIIAISDDIAHLISSFRDYAPMVLELERVKLMLVSESMDDL